MKFIEGLYTRSHEYKITRTQHEVCLKMGYTAGMFKKAFAKVPDEAKLIDWDERDSDTILVFEEEATEAVVEGDTNVLTK